MGPRVQKMMQSLPPNQQQQVQATFAGSQLTDILKNLNLGVFGKQMVNACAQWVETNLLPKLQAQNAMLGALVAGLLDAVEAATV